MAVNQKHWVCNRLRAAILRDRFVTESPGLRQARLRQASFVGHTCAKHSRQRYVTTGRNKRACNGRWQGPATKRGLIHSVSQKVMVESHLGTVCLFLSLASRACVFLFCAGFQQYLFEQTSHHLPRQVAGAFGQLNVAGLSSWFKPRIF